MHPDVAAAAAARLELEFPKMRTEGKRAAAQLLPLRKVGLGMPVTKLL